jgi:lysozyme family protein
MNFEQAFIKLIGHEGKYSNHPADPGGETQYGISKRSYPSLDIKNLTLDTAKTIYYADFWLATGCDKVPESVAFQIFDTAVNSGVKTAIRMSQRVVGAVEDGVLGPKTIQALQNMPPQKFIALFNSERLKFMASLDAWQTFSKGWALRIASNLREA